MNNKKYEIGFLGAGSWGFCLAHLLAKNGHKVHLWTKNKEVYESLKAFKKHPKFPFVTPSENLIISLDMKEVVSKKEILVESVTSKGLRSVLEEMKSFSDLNIPLILTSKGIEQHTDFILPEVVLDIFGKGVKETVGALSGPGFSHEVIQEKPTSVVASAPSLEFAQEISFLFNNDYFRVYPNTDLLGVSLGGALKNVIAVAAGISDGLGFGESAKAALLTRGLHEIQKLALAKGAKLSTLYGLSGMGDLSLTCGSSSSRNHKFGFLLAQGFSKEKAVQEIGMVVEGAYTALSAKELSLKYQIAMPITDLVYQVIYESKSPLNASKELMQRRIKEEYL